VRRVELPVSSPLADVVLKTSEDDEDSSEVDVWTIEEFEMVDEVVKSDCTDVKLEGK